MSARAGRPGAWAVLMAAAVAILVLRLWDGLGVQTDIRALLPAPERPAQVQVWVDRLQQQAMERTIVVFGATDRIAVELAAGAARSAVSATTAFTLEDTSAPASMAPSAAIREAAPLLLAMDDRRALVEEPVAYWVERAQRRLQGWGGMTSRTSFAEDPFGLFDRYLQDSLPDTGFAPRGPCLHRFIQGQHWCLLVLHATRAGFGLEALQQQREALDAVVAAARRVAPTVQVFDAGVSRHADYAARSSQQEMTRISVVSLLGITLLALALLGSVWPLLWVATVLGTGALCGLAVCALVFAELHLVALVFGTTLIGIGVDYAFHYLTADGPPRRRLASIRSGVFWGYATTATAFAALGLTGIPALQQVAITSVAGLGGALLAVHWLLPALPAGWLAQPRPGVLAWVKRAERTPPAGGRARALWLVLLVLLAVGLSGVSRLTVGENVRALHPVDPGLLARDAAARRIVGGVDAGQSVLVHAADAQSVLQQAESLQTTLRAARQAQELREWMSPQPLLVSQQRQAENRQLLEAHLLQAAGPLDRLQQQLGLPDSWVGNYRRRIAQATEIPAVAWALSAPPATPASAAGEPPASSPTAFTRAWAGWWQDNPQGSALVVRLGGVADAAALRQRITQTGLPGVLLVDGVADAARALDHTRATALQMLMLVGALIILVFLGKFGLRAFALLTPTAVSVLGVLGLLGWTGQAFGLFHLLSLLLVAGMSIDYALFLHEAGAQAGRSVLAIVASGLTTIAAFGMLGLSATPALAAMGQIVGLGVATALLLSLLLLRAGWLESRAYV